jgi:ceramide glucosyltransferase
MSLAAWTGTIARIGLHARSARHVGRFWSELPLVLVRDSLLALQWLGSVYGSHVVCGDVV